VLQATFRQPVDPGILGTLRRASEVWSRGDKGLASIYLVQLPIPRLDYENQAYSLFLADRLIASGYAARELGKALGFDLPIGLKTYNPDELRDDHGRWTTGGSESDHTTADQKRPETQDKQPHEMHFELASVQFIAGTMSDANPPGIVPGAQYAQLSPVPIILPKDMKHIRDRHTDTPHEGAGQFTPQFWSEEALQGLIAKAWEEAKARDVGPGKENSKIATAVIAFDTYLPDPETGFEMPYIIGTSGTGLHTPSVPTNTFVVVIDSNIYVRTCYPINPLDRENPRRTYDENTGDERD
jgi:hypothetical protein